MSRHGSKYKATLALENVTSERPQVVPTFLSARLRRPKLVRHLHADLQCRHQPVPK
jgi:hypothetical protein